MCIRDSFGGVLEAGDDGFALGVGLQAVSYTHLVTTQAVKRSMPRSFMSFRMAWDSW